MSDQRPDAKKGLPSYLRPAASGAQKAAPQSSATGTPSSPAAPVATGAGRGLPAYLQPDPPRPATAAQATSVVEPVAPPGLPVLDAVGLLRYAIAALCAVAIALVALSIEQRRVEADLAAKLRHVQLGMTGKEVTETAGPGERSDEGKETSRICYAFPAWRLLPGSGIYLAGGRVRIDPPPRLACFRLSRDVVIGRDLPE